MNIPEIIKSIRYKYLFPDSKKILTFHQLPYEEKDFFFQIRSEFYNKQLYISNYIESFNKNYDMYLCGDSVILAVDSKEQDKETLGQKISRQLNAKILSFNCGAFSPILYKDVFTLIPKTTLPKIFLLEFNLRSLSDEWYLRPAYQFESLRSACNSLRLQKILLSPIIEKIYLPYYFYITHSDAMLKKTKFYTETILKNSTTGYRRELAFRTSFHYCFPIEFIKVRIQNLISVIKILQHKNFIPYIFITPINYQLLIHKNEIPLMKNNIEKVKNYCLSAGALVKDFSELAASTEFTDAEHLKASGREKLVHEIKKWINIDFKSSTPKFTSYGIPNCICTRPEEMKRSAALCQKI